jgi:hypothetical protein
MRTCVVDPLLQVEHFSRYGLLDEDEEEDDDMGPAGGSPAAGGPSKGAAGASFKPGAAGTRQAGAQPVRYGLGGAGGPSSGATQRSLVHDFEGGATRGEVIDEMEEAEGDGGMREGEGDQQQEYSLVMHRDATAGM